MCNSARQARSLVLALIVGTLCGPAAAAEPVASARREQVGEVGGKPVYRDEIKDDGSVVGKFIGDAWQAFLQKHADEFKPTEAELKFATDWADRKQRDRIEEAGGETKLREQLDSLAQRLKDDRLSAADKKKVQLEQLGIESTLRPGDSKFFAQFLLEQWKPQKYLYDTYGGGRLLWQQAGVEAFDAMHEWIKQQEKQGGFKITDPKIRAKLYEYWTRTNHPGGLIDDKETIRAAFLEPEWLLLQPKKK